MLHNDEPTCRVGKGFNGNRLTYVAKPCSAKCPHRELAKVEVKQLCPIQQTNLQRLMVIESRPF
jgi:hypothetical protein